MEYHDKEILFKKFLSKWGEKLNKIPSIISHLSSYPEIAEKLDIEYPLKIDELYNSQLEWISLVAQLDNPFEKNFFKDYWVPIQKNNYDYFIDLSSDSLTLFDAVYFQFEPYQWYKNYVSKNLTQFIIDIGQSNFDVKSHFEEVEMVKGYINDQIIIERVELGYAGEIVPDLIDKDNLFNKELNSSFLFENNSITFSDINSLIVGLLPYEINITLTEFNAPYNYDDEVCEKIKNIKALVFLLQNVGMLSIDSYSISFDSNKDCRANFEDNTFTIIHKDMNLLRSMIEKYQTIKNS